MHLVQSYLCQFVAQFFFLNDTAPPEIYTLPLHDALPILFALRACNKSGEQLPPRSARHLRDSQHGGGAGRRAVELAGLTAVIHIQGTRARAVYEGPRPCRRTVGTAQPPPKAPRPRLRADSSR